MVAPLEMYYAALSIGCDGIVSSAMFLPRRSRSFIGFSRLVLEKALELQNRLLIAGKIVKEKEMAKCVALMKHWGAIATSNMRAPTQSLLSEEEKTF